ncbi:hypothetical protein WJX74_000289 [Apatococcus lobatus]|uniref:RED-like N-terminal domain-containing protein n=2 Tax=Apatococcus TaxID=904362 RepID=A0AAW1TFW2_9CHLO
MDNSRVPTGYVNLHRRGPLIEGLSSGPAFELEARIAAARDAGDLFTEQEQAAKRRRLQIPRENQANAGVHLRDLQDRSTLRTAAQKEDDRQAKLLQKVALYDRLHSGEAGSSSSASECLVDFERLVQERGPGTVPPGAISKSHPGFDPIEFRQRGTIQEEDIQVLRTGDFEQNQKRAANRLFDEVEKGPRGRGGLGIDEPNKHLRDEYEQKCDAIDADQQALAQFYQKDAIIMPANLGSDTLEAIEASQHGQPPGHQRSSSKAGKSLKQTQKARKVSAMTALQKAKEAVLKRQAADAAKQAPAASHTEAS